MFDPLKPHFYIVKLGFTWVYVIFHISAQNIDFGTRWNRLGEAVLTSTHNLCFEQKSEKYQNLLSEIFHSFGGKIFSIFEKACFRNVCAILWSTRSTTYVIVWQLQCHKMRR